VPVGLLAAAILMVNNIRDIDTDRRAGKRTLAVRLGERGAFFEYALLLAVAYAVPVTLFLHNRGAQTVLLPLLTLPLAAALVRAVARERGRALNPLLKRTAMLLLAHGLLFALGLVLTPFGIAR
jgi:1,4-dihydroxy-2-naphthoate octaprenyltransferase